MTIAQVQLDWWKGAQGDAYMQRNEPYPAYIEARADTFKRILANAGIKPERILEVGCGPGANLAALHSVLPGAALAAVEPNANARLIASGRVPSAHIVDGSAASLPFADDDFDFVLSVGVLVHVMPGPSMDAAVREMYRVSRRYLFLAEYFAPEPEVLEYRGQGAGLLWRGDFAGEFLDRFPDLRVIDTGFLYKRTTAFDSVTWFILEKASA